MKKGEDRVRVNIRNFSVYIYEYDEVRVNICNFSVYIYEYDEEVDIIPLTVTRQVFA